MPHQLQPVVGFLAPFLSYRALPCCLFWTITFDNQSHPWTFITGNVAGVVASSRTKTEGTTKIAPRCGHGRNGSSHYHTPNDTVPRTSLSLQTHCGTVLVLASM